MNLMIFFFFFKHILKLINLKNLLFFISPVNQHKIKKKEYSFKKMINKKKLWSEEVM